MTYNFPNVFINKFLKQNKKKRTFLHFVEMEKPASIIKRDTVSQITTLQDDCSFFASGLSHCRLRQAQRFENVVHQGRLSRPGHSKEHNI